MTEIARLLPGDRPRWTALWRDYLAFYGTQLPVETYDATWARIQAGVALHGLAARADGEIVGIVHFLFHDSAWTVTPVCYLQDVFVAPDARGRGVGQTLIEAVAEHARARDGARLYWLTQDHNAPARSLYDRLARYSGFIRYEYPLHPPPRA